MRGNARISAIPFPGKKRFFVFWAMKLYINILKDKKFRMYFLDFIKYKIRELFRVILF